MTPLRIELEELEDSVILHFSGSSTTVAKQSDEVTALREIFKDIVSSGRYKALIDLKEVDYLASNIIGSFLSGNAIMNKAGGKLVIYNASDYLKGIFDIVQLDKVIPICKTYEDAVTELEN